MLTKRGVWRIDSGVDAICRYSDPKNTALFEAMGVLKPNECAAAWNTVAALTLRR